MKIALIVPGGVDRSGEYRVIPAVLALLRQWMPRHEVHVYSLAPEPDTSRWKFGDAFVHPVGPKAGPPRAGVVIRAFNAIAREHRRAPFQIVQAMWAGWPGSIAVLAGKRLHIPACVHIAGGELAALPEIGYGGLLRWTGRWRERLIVRSADAVSAASRLILEQIGRFGVEGRQIPLGVDLDVWPPRVPGTRDIREAARLIHVASLNRVKDPHTLLRAMKFLVAHGKQFTLDIVGEDTLHGEIQAFAAREGLGDVVRFHGYLTQAQMRPLMERAHINLISSRHEAGPLVFLEAAVAGVPSVSTAIGHPRDFAPDAAVCVPACDPDAFGAAVLALLDDEDRRMGLAREAQQRAIAMSAAHTANLFEAQYAELLRRS
jgi:glycosyltransferase involved in cell wall biosynthesis